MIGEWFNEGAEAYGRGVKADDCPYPVGTEQESEWLAGWTEAKGLATTGQSGASAEPEASDDD